MATAPHQALQAKRLDCGFAAVSSGLYELVSSHHARIQPIDLSCSFDAADHADVRPVDLGNNRRNQMLGQPVSVRQSYVFLMPSHSESPHNSKATNRDKHNSECGAQASEFGGIVTAPWQYGVPNWSVGVA